MDETEILQRLGLALAIGLLFGLERGWNKREAGEGNRLAGIRTFALAGLLGGVTGWLSSVTGPLVLAGGFLGISVLMAATYAANLRSEQRRHDEESPDLGATTEFALILSFALGAAAVLADIVPTAAAAVVAAILLSAKKLLHEWIAAIRRVELSALFQLAVISVVVLPILPDQGFGPGEVLNPYEIWWAVFIVASLSFFGYAAIRFGGERIGVAVTGVFGGMASSTSTTLALSRMVRDRADLAPTLAVGIVLAGSVTFFRVLLIAGIFDPAMLPSLVLPMAVMGATGLAGALAVFALAQDAARAAPGLHDLPNPMALRLALGFGVILALVMLASHYLERWFGDEGLYAAAAVAGLTDVDAITVSMSRMSGSEFDHGVAATAIVIAVAVNTVVKGAIAAILGGKALGWRVIAVYALVLSAGALTLSATA